MIRINLARSLNLNTPAINTNSLDADNFSFEGAERPSDNKKLLLNFVIILLGPALVWWFMTKSVEDTKKQFQQMTVESTELDNKINDLTQKAPQIAQQLEELEIVDKNLLNIKSIADQRLLPVRAFDAIQSLIPEKTWLAEIELEGTNLKISGFSDNSEGLPLFMKSLEESVYFSSVSVLSNSQEMGKSGKILKFQLACVVGDGK